MSIPVTTAGNTRTRRHGVAMRPRLGRRFDRPGETPAECAIVLTPKLS
jgi:hypothetical protein